MQRVLIIPISHQGVLLAGLSSHKICRSTQDVGSFAFLKG